MAVRRLAVALQASTILVASMIFMAVRRLAAAMQASMILVASMISLISLPSRPLEKLVLMDTVEILLVILLFLVSNDDLPTCSSTLLALLNRPPQPLAGVCICSRWLVLVFCIEAFRDEGVGVVHISGTLLLLLAERECMDFNARGDPQSGNLVVRLVLDVDSQVLQRVEAAFKEADGVLGPDSEH
ncbi:hypothetical protein GGX14DRAFT_560602 [Mycena pura]|uniref:Uncharacterized protein n=1 Tax=Mycena pura TaxID=153505 RepID=A0AAD6YGZ4_9AGAR|nr:hypothetical protein GGX14DRAFT_560602 [Mycena pura]